ncbi:MAG: quinate 5-dehydrogenase [Anaerolineales bacterium]|jgi:hypothetical protein
MKRAVSISLGSSSRDKHVQVEFKGVPIIVERIGTDGDIAKARHLYLEMDGQVDAFGVGGVDLFLRLDEREYPLRSALKLVEGLKSPCVDGRGLKHTLERRVFELAYPQLNDTLDDAENLHFQQAFIPVAADRLGLAQAVAQVSDQIVLGDLMVALGIPIPVRGIASYKKIAQLLFPVVSHFPMSMLFYGSSGIEREPKYDKFWRESDLLAGDFLFMRKHVIDDLAGKTVITNTTTPANLEFLRERGVSTVITTTPRYDGRTFGTNMMEAAITAYAGKGRPLTDDELNVLIDELELRPTVQSLNK